MARSRRYLNNLPNAEEIKTLAGEILTYELKMDKAVYEGEQIKNQILSLENDLKTLDKNETPQTIESTKEKLKHLSNNLVVNENEINDLRDYILKLQSTVNEEIREGLSNLFHQAKSCTEEAQKNISKYQKMTENAQKKLLTANGDELKKYHQEWILNVHKVIKYQEMFEKCKKELDAIKRVYTLEFG